MLVLSRREGEKLVFPDLDVVLQVLDIKGNSVRLGVQAPAKIAVLRSELAEFRGKMAALHGDCLDELSGKRAHRVRNWLHVANLAMPLIRRYVEADRVDDAAQMLRNVIDEFQSIEGEVARPLRAAAGPQRDEPLRRPGSPGNAESHRALLVEDNANERQLLAGFLRAYGFDVATAGDGTAALDYLSSHDRPDLILLDMLMPRCDGPTMLRTLRGDPKYYDLKVFAISGASPAQLGVASGNSGVNRWFRKPVDPESLVREICLELDVAVPQSHV